MVIIDTTSKMSFYQQIYSQIKEDIFMGSLKAGSRLTATRLLADELGVARNTVIAAYDQLEIEGYIYSKRGSGYYVNKVYDSSYSQKMELPPPYMPPQSKSTNNIKYDFQYGAIDTTVFPNNHWKKSLLHAHDAMMAETSLIYIDKQGEYKLRKAISHYLYHARGVNCNPDQIIITSGHQQSLEYISRIFDCSNYSFSMEEPGYDGSRNIFEKSQYKMNPIELDKNGINLSKLDELSNTLLYLTPSHQFPTGCILPIAKRLSILSWAQQKNSYIIEDDYDSELRYDTLPIPSLHSLDHHHRTIYLGTFSKSLSPDLRISYMVLPPKAVSVYHEIYQSSNCTVSKIMQLTLADFFENGQYEKHLNILRTYYKKKHDLLHSSIRKIFKDKASIQGKGAGLHILVTFDTTLEQSEIINRAKEKGIIIYPVDIYWFQGEKAPKNQILLGYGNIQINDIPTAIECLYNIIFQTP